MSNGYVPGFSGPEAAALGANLRGPRGPQGSQGDQGEAGNGVLTGAIASRPSAATYPGGIHHANDAGLPSRLRESFSNASGWRVPVAEYTIFDFAPAGSAPDGSTYFDTAVVAAIAFMSSISPSYGLALRFPRAVDGTAAIYKFAGPIRISRGLILRGEGRISTRFVFDPGQAGIVVDIAGTSPDGGDGGDAYVHDVRIIGSSPAAWTANTHVTTGTVRRPTDAHRNRYTYVALTTGTTHSTTEPTWPTDAYNPSAQTVVDGGVTWRCQLAHGVALRRIARFERVLIDGFEGDGFNVEADVNSMPLTNANGWSAANVRVQNVQGNGFFVRGGDSSAASIEACDVDLSGPNTALASGLWCYNEGSFLGNKYAACQAAFGASGNFKTTNSTRSTFVGCYSENAANPNVFDHLTLVLGGILAGQPWVAGDNGQGVVIGENAVSAFTTGGAQGSVRFGLNGGIQSWQGAAEGAPLVLRYIDATANPGHPYRGSYVESYNAGDSNPLPGFVLTGAQSPGGSLNAGQLWLSPGNQGIPVGNGGNGQPARYAQVRGGFYSYDVAAAGGGTLDWTTIFGWFYETVALTGTLGAGFTIHLGDRDGDIDSITFLNLTTQSATVVRAAGGASVVIPSGKGARVVHAGTRVYFDGPIFDPTTGAAG